MIFTTLFLALSVSLIAWQLYWKDKASILLGAMTFVFLGLTVLNLIQGGFSSLTKLGSLALGFISLSVLSMFALRLREIKWIRLPYLACSAVLLFQLLKFTTPSPTPTPKHSMHSIKYDTSAELLVELHPKNLDQFMIFCAENPAIECTVAFSPEFTEETDLDDYVSVNLLDESPQKLEAMHQLLSEMEIVEYVEINEFVDIPELHDIESKVIGSSRYIFSDPMADQQWGLQQTNMNDVFKIIQNNKPQNKAILYILDTGVDSEHPDLVDIYGKTKAHHDKDVKGHGTHCAGIAGAMTGNFIGISSYNAGGIYEVRSIKVLADYGGGTQQGIIKGMIEAIDKGADVISMSLGGRSSHSRQKAYDEVVKYAERKNCIIVTAAGNSNSDAKNYCPANSNGVITVAAVDHDLQKASFSNTLENIKMGVSAPGVDILSTFPGDRYERLSGTSMATPYVAGFIALMKSYKPDLTSEEAFQLINDTGISTQDARVKNVINPSQSLEKLLK